MPIYGPEELLKRELATSKSLVVTDLNLNGINMSCRALLGLEFRRCQLIGADFRGADLSLARFFDCDLYRADFTDSVLYTTWFYECNLTKADFSRAYLLGFRLRNSDITKTKFDEIPAVGVERKTATDISPQVVKLPFLGALPAAAPELESGHTGIAMARFDKVVTFIGQSGPESEQRARIRAAETARYLRKAHSENGYDDRATHYYIVERRLRRMAMTGGLAANLKRAQDYVFGEAIWRYGSSVLRPILAAFSLAFLGTLLTFLAPSISSPGTGLESSSLQLYRYVGWHWRSLVNFFDVLYFYMTGPIGGSGAQLSGWVKCVFVAYVLSALWLIALIFDSFTRRVGSAE